MTTQFPNPHPDRISVLPSYVRGSLWTQFGGVLSCCMGKTGHTEYLKSEDLPIARISLVDY